MSPAASTLRISTSPLPASRLAVELAVPGDRTQASYDAAVESLSRSVKLPGFRKGKVPRAVLLQQIGPLRIRATALESLVDSAFREALDQEKIEAISQPSLAEGFELVLERFSPGSELSFTLEMDVEPSPTLKSTKGLSASATVTPHDPARVDELIEQSRRQLATLVPVEGRSADKGDVVVVGFAGTFTDTNEAISGGSSDAMEVELEDGRMIPGFVEGIVGMAVDETRTIACQFPENYPQEDARGREASFVITLKELKTRELPALDDAFAQQASDKASLAELRADVEQRLQEEAERRNKASRNDALLEALVAELEVELPESMVQKEIRNLIEQTASQLAQQGMDVKSLFTPELVRSLMESSREEAETRLRRTLALKALAETESISVAEEDLNAKVAEVTRNLSDTSRIDPERLKLAVADDLLREALMTWLEANSTITETTASAADDNEA